jgi:prevent-host-death family protein
MTREIPVTQARGELSDLVSRVAFSGERVSLTRHGKPVAALVSAADLELLESLEQERAAGFSVARVHPVAAPEPTRRRYDIAAEHRQPGQQRPRPPG